jgi:hypothetical protein
MSSTKVMRAPELRAEVARRQVSRLQMAKDLGISYSVRPKRVRKHEQKIYRLTQTRIDNNLTVPVFMYGGVLQCLPGASPINP